jgi:tripartite-type tricarboxylate transporter receptor subunit TctC
VATWRLLWEGSKWKPTVHNPSEQLSCCKDGRSRPLAVFLKHRIDQPLWKEVPTIQEVAGKELEYVLRRDNFAASDISATSRDWLTELMQKVYETEDFQKFLLDNALFPKFMASAELAQFVGEFHTFHANLMRQLEWIK